MKRITILVLVFLFPCSVIFARSGGPDEFGYSFIDNHEPGGPTFSWIEIMETGTRLSLSDDSYQMVSLDGTFKYYGIDYDRVYVCSNGWISFTTGASSIGIGGIPNTRSPNATLAVYNADLYPSGAHTAYYERRGDLFIIEYDVYYCCTPSGPTNKFEVILNMRNGMILFQYLSLNVTRTITIGIENETGTIGLNYGSVSSPSHLPDSTAIMFRAVSIVGLPFSYDFPSTDDIEGFDVPEETGGWEVGTPTSVGPSSAHSSPYCMGTNISGYYEDYADYYLYTPRIMLGGSNHPYFTFWHWYQTEEGRDGGVVEISTDDGDTWEVLFPEDGYPTPEMGTGSSISGLPGFSGTSDGWEKVECSLLDYIDYTVYIRFHFGATEILSDYPGWYVDDVGASEAFGVIHGTVDLRYSDNDSGVIVSVEGQNVADTTDIDGTFFLDSVMIGIWRVNFSCSHYLPYALDGVTIGKDDTLEINTSLSPELYNVDLEIDDGRLSATPDSGETWGWGEPDTSLIPLPGAHSGTHCWGTILNGNYPNIADLSLDLQLFTGDLVNPVLTFWQWYQFDGEFESRYFDGGNVKLSTDGGESFSVIEPVGGYPGTISSHNPFTGGEPGFGGMETGNFWHLVVFDLSDVDTNFVIIRWEVGTDGSGNAIGWYIDDIKITERENILGANRLPEICKIDAFPNPFNSNTKIEFTTSSSGRTTVSVFNILGRRVETLIDEQLPAGYHSTNWNAEQFPSGVYLISLTCNGEREVKKILLLR